jgi:hypothetical protein
MSITYSIQQENKREKIIRVDVIVYKFFIPYTLKSLEFTDPSIAITTDILTLEEKKYYGNLPIIYTDEFKEYLKNHKYSYEKYVDLL